METDALDAEAAAVHSRLALLYMVLVGGAKEP
jgi:hypothetical protein